MEKDRLYALIRYSTAGDRICPQPMKWDAFWRLLGFPRDRPGPLILSGWAFSTDREKRERFREHIAYAEEKGLLIEADQFLRALENADWHTCPDHRQDWSYGDALIEDEERRQAAIASAAKHYNSLKLLTDNEAFNNRNLAQTLHLYHLLSRTENGHRLADLLRVATSHFSSLVQNELSLLNDVPACIGDTLTDINRAKHIELLLLELLSCITDAGIPLDRDSIQDFVQDLITVIEN